MVTKLQTFCLLTYLMLERNTNELSFNSVYSTVYL